MVPHQHVVLLGPSNSGKTTFMATAYATLQRSNDRFSIRCSDENEHNFLETVADNLKRGEFPLPTDQRATLETHVYLKHEHVLDVTWVDHRGGAALELFRSSPELRHLVDDISRADGIILFCDAENVSANDDEALFLDEFIPLLTQAASGDHIPSTLVVLITKTDRVTEYSPSGCLCIQDVINLLRCSREASCFLADVSCYPKVRHVRAVMETILSSLVFGQGGKDRREASEEEEAAVRYRSWHRQETFGEKWDRWWDGGESYKARARSREANRDYLLARAQSYERLGASSTKPSVELLRLAVDVQFERCIQFLNREKTWKGRLRLLLRLGY